MSGEFESRLRRHLAAADEVEVSPVSAVLSSAEQIARRRQLRRRLVAGSFSVVLVASAAAFVAIGFGDDGGVGPPASRVGTDRPVPTSAAPTTSPPPTTLEPDEGDDPVELDDPGEGNSGSAWSAIPADPTGVRVSPQAVWTGAAAIAVYGADGDGEPRTDVSSYVPATRQWRTVADPPIEDLDGAHVDPVVTWTGDELLMIGGHDDEDVPVDVALAYEPHTDTWRSITAPGVAVDATQPSVWAGEELLVWSADGPMAYDPTGDAWRDLASPPVAARTHAASVWTGAEWIVWGGSDDGSELADGAAYDPTADSWRTIAPSPLSARRVSAVWTGSEMVVASGASGGADVPTALADAAAYDPATDTWRSMADGFGHPGIAPVWTGHELVLFAKGTAVVHDSTSGSWRYECCSETGGGPGGTPVWTGTSIVLIGSQHADAGGSVFTVPAGDPGDPAIEIDIDVDRPEVTSIGRTTARIPRDAFETPHNPMTTDAGDMDAASPGHVYLNTWLAASCGCQIGIYVGEDFGDDAPLYEHLADAPRMRSGIGEWMLMEGESPREPTVALLRIDGLVLQVSVVADAMGGDGGTVGADDVLEAVVDSIEIRG